MNLFGKKKKAEAPKLSDSIQQLRQAMELLERREQHLVKQQEAAHAAAKEKAKKKDKRGALFQLKRKKMLEKQIDQIYGKKQNIEVQIMALESAASNKQLLNVMRAGKDALQAAVNESDIENVADVMDDINESIVQADELSDALAQPLGAGSQIDDEDLAHELDELESELMDEQVLETPAVRPIQAARPVVQQLDAPSVPVGAPKSRVETADEKEARELQELENIMNA